MPNALPIAFWLRRRTGWHELKSPTNTVHKNMHALPPSSRRPHGRRSRMCARDGSHAWSEIFDGAAIGIVMLSPEGEILHVNRQLARMTGYTVGELLAMDIYRLHCHGPVAHGRTYYRQLVCGGLGSSVFETRFVRKDGTVFWVNSTVTLVSGLRGRPDRLIATYEGMDEDRRMVAAEAIGVENCQMLVDTPAREEIARCERERRRLEQRAQAAERALVNVSDHTLRNIGRELHDDLGQMFCVGALLAKSIARRVKELSPVEAQSAELLAELMNHAVKKTRAFSRGLCPADAGGGLVQMLRSMIDYFHLTGAIDVDLSCTWNDGNLPPETELHVYRIVQEAATNALRHSGASKISIAITPSKRNLRIEIGDNGCGFEVGKNEGLGLRTIKHRAAMINGRVHIARGEPVGSVVTVIVPFVPLPSARWQAAPEASLAP